MDNDHQAKPKTSFDAPDASSAAADESIPVSRFDQAYAMGRPPWDIDGPQPDFARLIADGAISGRVLDVGCGTGEHALYFASHGLQTVGLDASAIAVRRASIKAADRDVSARFVEGDVTQLAVLQERFDTITDSGCLHTLSDEDMQRAVAGAHTVLRPGGTYWLMCFNEHATVPGPRRITRERITELFADSWQVHSIHDARFELVAPEVFGNGASSSAWLARIERL
jgi:SAM-dependent methyltransferase